MSEINTGQLIEHFEEQTKRLYDPLKVEIETLKADLHGNGKEGLKTMVAVQQKTIESLIDDIKDIKFKADRSQWFSIVTLIGIVISIIVPLIVNK